MTAAESGTYTDFAQNNVGVLRPDGSDGVNEVSYLLLDVIEDMRLLQPSSSLQVSKKNPDRFVRRAAKIIRTGFGQPSVFNADLIVQELMRQGKSVADARNGGSSGCVEVGAFGKENYNLTGYFNLPKVLEITLNNGIDPRTGKSIGLSTGNPASFSSFNELFSAFEAQVNHFINIKIRGRNLDEVEAQGVELELEGTLENGIKGRISYAFQESENKQTGKDLSNSPQHLRQTERDSPGFQREYFSWN